MARFPFGASVLPRGVDLPRRRYPVVVVGAYPSALHVRWTPPPGYGSPVAALPVDNEPTPFWGGDPAEVAELFRRWHEKHFRVTWGEVRPAKLNGPSGRGLESQWLFPLGYRRDDAFITDCLTTARASTAVATRLRDRYAPVVRDLDAPPADLAAHPTEASIVEEALSTEAQRLHAQISAARPDLIVTLGNAAARVIGHLGGVPGDARLRTVDYGRDRHVQFSDRNFCWVALAHPAAPRRWIERHHDWAEGQDSDFRHEPQPGDTVIALGDDGTPTVHSMTRP